MMVFHTVGRKSGYHSNGSVCTYAIFAMVILTMILAGCSTDEEDIIQRTIGDSDPDQRLVSPRIVITENGRTSGIVTSDSLAVMEKSDYTTLDGNVDMQFFAVLDKSKVGIGIEEVLG